MIITIDMTFAFIQSEPNRSNVEHRFMMCSSADMFSNSERTCKILVYLTEIAVFLLRILTLFAKRLLQFRTPVSSKFMAKFESTISIMGMHFAGGF